MKNIRKILSIILTAVMLTALVPTVFAAEKQTVSVRCTYGQTEARTILPMINNLRQNDAWYIASNNRDRVQLTNLKPLSYDYSLEKIAMQRAAEIAVSFSHTRPNGESCFTAYTDEFRYGMKAENIAMGQKSAKAVNTAFEEENENYSGQGHRRNMLNESAVAVGIAHAKIGGVDYWVEEFAGVKSGQSATKALDGEADCTVEILPSYASRAQALSAKPAAPQVIVPSQNNNTDDEECIDCDKTVDKNCSTCNTADCKNCLTCITANCKNCLTCNTADCRNCSTCNKSDKNCSTCGKKEKAASKPKTPSFTVKSGKKKLTVDIKKVKNASCYEVKCTQNGKCKTQIVKAGKTTLNCLGSGNCKVSVKACTSKGKNACKSCANVKKAKIK